MTPAGYSATPLARKLGIKTGLDGGLVDNKIRAFDATWSGLRFVYRPRDR